MAKNTPSVDLTGFTTSVPASTSADEKRRNVTLDIDFTGVPFADVISHAVRSIKIDWQRDARKRIDTLTDGETVTVDAKAYAPGRRVVDPVAKASRALSGLTRL